MPIDVDFTMLMTFQMIAAIILALPTAYNRERSGRIMGLRTFPLVSLGSCAYILVGQTFIGPDDSGSMARMMQGLLSGIGFIGGGAILKSQDKVKGTASAASIWITGAVGAAVGLQAWSIAISLSILNFLVIWSFGFLKDEIKTEKEPFEHDDDE